jgi:hypothetical protein
VAGNLISSLGDFIFETTRGEKQPQIGVPSKRRKRQIAEEFARVNVPRRGPAPDLNNGSRDT